MPEKTENMDRQFDALLAKAEGENELAYLVTLYGSWYPAGQVAERRLFPSDFVELLSEWVRKLIMEKGTPDRPYLYHEMLFLFQLIIESKPYYATLRNFVNSASGARIAPEPWRQDEWSNAGSLLTGKLLKHLGEELDASGFEELASEFKIAHDPTTRKIRNAIAHGTFLVPSEKTEQHWIFADYVRDERASAKLDPLRIPHEEFTNLYGRVLGLRQSLFGIMRTRKEQIGTKHRMVQATDELQSHGYGGFKFTNGSMSMLVESEPDKDWLTEQYGIQQY